MCLLESTACPLCGQEPTITWNFDWNEARWHIDGCKHLVLTGGSGGSPEDALRNPRSWQAIEPGERWNWSGGWPVQSRFYDPDLPY